MTDRYKSPQRASRKHVCNHVAPHNGREGKIEQFLVGRTPHLGVEPDRQPRCRERGKCIRVCIIIDKLDPKNNLTVYTNPISFVQAEEYTSWLHFRVELSLIEEQKMRQRNGHTYIRMAIIEVPFLYIELLTLRRCKL